LSVAQGRAGSPSRALGQHKNVAQGDYVQVGQNLMALVPGWRALIVAIGNLGKPKRKRSFEIVAEVHGGMIRAARS
jgi:hypothetical protein